MNIQQRKVLEKVIKDTISRKRNKLWDLRVEAKEKEEKELEKKGIAKATAVLKEVKVLKEKFDRKEEELKELGFNYRVLDDYDRERGKKELYINLTGEQDDKLENEHRARQDSLEEVETKLVAKVWGVEGDFDSLLKELETELAKI